MNATFEIAGRPIGPDFPPYVVAELSGNHGGNIDRALDLIIAAKNAGADAIKLQTYTPDTMTIDHDGPDFRISGGLWDGRGLYELYGEAHTPWEWHQALYSKARDIGIPIFSTPFDESAVDFLEALDSPAFKIASFELVDLELIRRVAATGKPTIISTGMGSPEEIADAVETFRAHGGGPLCLLHCVSGYPTPEGQSNLRRIPKLAARFNCPVGLSDHTLGTAVSITAVALGACFIEKHVTMRRSDGGPDAAFSLEPEELAVLTAGCKTAWHALGDGAEQRSAVEKNSMVFRRSIYVIKDIAQGEAFTSENVRVIRPGFGMAPKALPQVLGRPARRALTRGTALHPDMVD